MSFQLATSIQETLVHLMDVVRVSKKSLPTCKSGVRLCVQDGEARLPGDISASERLRLAKSPGCLTSGTP